MLLSEAVKTSTRVVHLSSNNCSWRGGNRGGDVLYDDMLAVGVGVKEGAATASRGGQGISDVQVQAINCTAPKALSVNFSHAYSTRGCNTIKG